jgi:chaperonin cofactor prefoldin
MLERLRKVKAPIDPSAVLELEKRIGTLDEDIQGCRSKNADLQNNLPAHILCHGIITGIRWERSPESGVPDPDEPFKIAMGDTAVESFGTLFEKALSGDLGKLLAVFQYDLLSELEKPGGVAIVDYKVHERSYRRLARGIRWDLMQESHPTFSGSPEDRSPPNPGDIRALLEQLNMRQGRINRLKRERDSLRSELYATWYKKVLNTAAQGKKASEDALNERLANLTTEIEGLTVKITELEEEGHPKGTEWEEIQRQLNTFLPGWKLQQFDEPEFWRPNDPVLLLAGKAFQRSRRHGEDGRFRSDGRLLCRLSGQEITRIKIKIPYAKEDVEFGSAEDFKKWGTPFAPLGGRPLPMEVNNLLREALVLTLDAKRAHDIVTAAHEKIEPGSRSDEGPAFRPPEGPVESQSAASRVRRAGPLQPTAAMLLGRR